MPLGTYGNTLDNIVVYVSFTRESISELPEKSVAVNPRTRELPVGLIRGYAKLLRGLHVQTLRTKTSPFSRAYRADFKNSESQPLLFNGRR